MFRRGRGFDGRLCTQGRDGDWEVSKIAIFLHWGSMVKNVDLWDGNKGVEAIVVVVVDVVLVLLSTIPFTHRLSFTQT